MYSEDGAILWQYRTMVSLYVVGRRDWAKLHRLFEGFMPLGIMGARLRAPRKPIGTMLV